MENPERFAREQLANQIRGGNAFIKIEEVLEKVPFDELGKQFPGLPYTFWQQFEHMRITQWDILEFSTNKNYQPLEWPADYWTPDPGPTAVDQWEASKKLFFQDRETFLNLITDTGIDWMEPFTHGHGQTLYREALLILEHNAYHTGQLMLLLRLINKNRESH